MTASIVDANVTLAKMAANSVDSGQYVDGSIDLIHLSDNSVDSRCYVDESIDLAHLSDDSVDSRCIVDGSLDFVHLDSAVYESDLASSASASKLCTASSVKTYVDGRTYVRKLFSAQSLTADTEATLNHALSNKYVSVQVFNDTDDKEVDFELTLTDANNCKVEVAVSGTYSILVIG